MGGTISERINKQISWHFLSSIHMQALACLWLCVEAINRLRCKTQIYKYEPGCEEGTDQFSKQDSQSRGWEDTNKECYICICKVVGSWVWYLPRGGFKNTAVHTFILRNNILKDLCVLWLISSMWVCQCSWQSESNMTLKVNWSL